MKQNVKNLVGICGLYCGTCPYYLAYRKNDTACLTKLAQEECASIEELRCDGCLSENVSCHCKACRHGFRTCASEKGVNWCFECSEFPCQRLKDFTEIHVVNGIKHHEHVIDDLMDMKENGIAQWVERQDQAARCTGCGQVRYWFDRACPDCSGTA
jgi:hypothetical protein